MKRALWLLVVAACSSSSSGGGGSGLFEKCPAQPPKSGDPCGGSGVTYGDLACEYGSDPDSRCNVVARCQYSKSPMDPKDIWLVGGPESGVACPSNAQSNVVAEGGDCPLIRPRLGEACSSVLDDRGGPARKPVCNYCQLSPQSIRSVTCYDARWTNADGCR
jgi:hypothetical protein